VPVTVTAPASAMIARPYSRLAAVPVIDTVPGSAVRIAAEKP
jgi:hypothetical protein